MIPGAGSFQNLQIDSSRWHPKIGSFVLSYKWLQDGRTSFLGC